MKKRTALLIAVVSGAIGITVGAVAGHHEAATDMTHFTNGNYKWAPVNPEKPDGNQIAVLHGNPETGPVAFALKVKKGNDPGIHKHTSDYHAVVLTGKHKHWWSDDAKGGDAKSFGEHSYWFQKGGDWHGDSCTSKKGCTIFLYMPGKLDFVPKDPPKAKKKAM